MPVRRTVPRFPIPSAIALPALLATLLAGCGGGGDGETDVAIVPVVMANAQPACEALAGKTIAAGAIGEASTGATVTSAVFRKAVADANNATNTAVTLATPDYCELLVDIKPVDPAAPIVKSQVNLPASWNGKKLQFGGAGYNGSLVNGLEASRNAPANVARPLTQGYMTAGTDSGHQNAAGVEAYAFALNAEALNNMGYASYKKTHDVAMSLARMYYQKRPYRSYYMGGSEGGREGMMMAQRYPADYDGIIAIDPVMNWSALQTFGNYVGGILQARPGGYLGGKTQLVHDTVLAACDSLDGLADQVISNYRACKPIAAAALKARRCASGADEGATCFSDAQLAVLDAGHTGYTFSFDLANGMRSYAGFGYGGEALPGNWSAWMVGTASPTTSTTAAAVNQLYRFGNGYVRYFIAKDPNFDPLTYNPSAFQARVQQVSAIMDATNPDLAAFRARGGKLILREDLSDTAQSPYTGLNYWDAVVARMGAVQVEDFFAAFVATGLPHTSGGIAPASANAPAYGIPGRVDLLPVLEAWVERGVSPSLQYTLTNNLAVAPFTVTASKPLCRYPLFPKYVGPGTTGGADAANFTCVAQ